MATTPEGKVKLAVKRWLDARGAWWFTPMSNGMGRHGIPDFLCSLNGWFVAIETKAPGKRGTTTPLQRREIDAINQSGGIAVVVDDASQLDHLLGDLLRAGQ